MSGQQPFTGTMEVGATLGKYEIQEQVASGGMAVIYKAYDPGLDRAVAVKQIAPHLAQDERFAERFRTEAQSLARISASQANIVNVYELIERDSQLFLVMEYVEGKTLRAMMDRGAVPLQTGLGVVLSTALGLKAMHAGGIVHRDLTPANIMMTGDGGLKITDFGLIGHSGGRTSLPMGTTKYMAPELFTGAVIDPRADIYSLGFIAYEMLLGPEAFAEVFSDVLRDERAQQVRWMHWHSNANLQAPSLKEVQPGIPPLISKIVERMMDKDAAKRFGTADQIIRWLRRIFVMNVKGQGLTEADSQHLEEEIEQDVVSPQAPAVPPPGASRGEPTTAAPSARPPARRQEAPVPAAPSAEKTAPLKVSKWTWKRAAIWGGIIAGAMILVSIAGVVITDAMKQARLDEAQGALGEADALYEAGEWAEAAAAYEKVARKYPRLRTIREKAYRQHWQAKSEKALEQRDWAEADRALGKVQEKQVRSSWVSDFRDRLNKSREIAQQMSLASTAEDNGQLEEAINIYNDLRSLFGDDVLARQGHDLSSRIVELQDKLRMRAYRAQILEGRALVEKGQLEAALSAFQRARRVRQTPEVVDLIQDTQSRMQFRKTFARAEEAFAQGDWGTAEDLYAQALKVRPSEQVKAKRDRARAEGLAEKARGLSEAELPAEAVEIWAQVLQFYPQHPEALREIRQFKQADRLKSHIDAGDDAIKARNWQQAIRSYEDALRLMPADHEDRARITDELARATYQAHVDQAREYIERKEWTAAQDEIGKARQVKDTQELSSLAERIETLKGYHLHFDMGKGLLSRSEWLNAKAAFERAREIMDTAEVNDLIVETDYRRYLAQGKYYLDQEEYAKAAAFFNLARRQKRTVEVEGWLERAQRLQQEKDAGEKS
jgi:serine/threonine protein kinase/tetratricopeptide (TPR) repeat protein